jgi:hypothetical protein
MRPEKYSDEQKTASKRYSSLQSRVEYNLEDYWDREEFIDWYITKEKKCCYCGCTMDELTAFYKSDKSKRKRTRGQNLEIERKEDEKYSENNCDLACYWCNNAKSDVFDVEEFEPIGKAIGDAIKARVNNSKD